MESREKTRHRFFALDAKRGLAALAVVIFHNQLYLGHYISTHAYFGHAYLAVDFFFMLSGFVLTMAYENRLNEGWPMLSFMKIRLERLYPLYALGLALGVLEFGLRWRSGHASAQPHAFAMWLALAVCMLPVPPWMNGGGGAFVFDGPAWSVAMELLANIFHALFLRRGTLMLGLVLGLSGVSLILSVLHWHTLNIGAYSTEIVYTMPRVLFSYTLGILLFKIWERRQPRCHGICALMSCSLLLLALQSPPLSRGAEYVYDAFVLLILFPAILLVGASSRLKGSWASMASFLGRISYAVYILHAPISSYWPWLMIHIGHPELEFDSPLAGIAFLLIILLISAAAEWFYDRPARRWMGASLNKSKIRGRTRSST